MLFYQHTAVKSTWRCQTGGSEVKAQFAGLDCADDSYRLSLVLEYLDNAAGLTLRADIRTRNSKYELIKNTNLDIMLILFGRYFDILLSSYWVFYKFFLNFADICK